MKIAIVGAGGRIGQSLTSFLLDLYEVVPVSTKNSAGYFSWDILFDEKFLNSISVVVYLAASSVPKVSEERIFGEEWRVDIPLLVSFLQRIQQARAKNIHIVYFSSAGVMYGPVNKRSATEDDCCFPTCLYGWAKYHSEQLLEQFVRRNETMLTILRVTNVYGISAAENDQQGIIPYIIKSAAQNTPLYVWGDGEGKKDYIHIDDLARAVTLIIDHKITGLFNVSFGESYSVNELVDIVENKMCKNIKCIYQDQYPWDAYNVYVNSDKFKQTTGWTPKVSIEEGISRTINYMRKKLAQDIRN